MRLGLPFRVALVVSIASFPCQATLTDYVLPAAMATSACFLIAAIPAYKEMQNAQEGYTRNATNSRNEQAFKKAKIAFIARLSVGGVAGVIAFLTWLDQSYQPKIESVTSVPDQHKSAAHNTNASPATKPQDPITTTPPVITEKTAQEQALAARKAFAKKIADEAAAEIHRKRSKS